MTTTALSLFGTAYEPADPPATTMCPACGTPSPNGRRCTRCRAAGIEAPRLDLAPAEAAPELEPETADDEPAEWDDDDDPAASPAPTKSKVKPATFDTPGAYEPEGLIDRHDLRCECGAHVLEKPSGGAFRFTCARYYRGKHGTCWHCAWPESMWQRVAPDLALDLDGPPVDYSEPF